MGPSARTRSRATDQGERDEDEGAGGGGGAEATAAPVALRGLVPRASELFCCCPAAAAEAEWTIILVLTTSIGAVHVVVTRPVAADAARCVAAPSSAPVIRLQARLAAS